MNAIPNNPLATEWLALWGDYLRAVDNLADEGGSRFHFLQALALGCQCYSHPFYVTHAAQLQVAALSATSLWDASCRWEKAPDLWKRQWADVLRHADVIMLFTVTMICNGFESANAGVREFLAVSYIDHKDKHGVPT